ncbi:MAG: hypothetical protein WCA46_21845 [Actinocatenispora sp.]
MGQADSADRVIVVDAANVVGSVPDGWWHDRAGAAARLRDLLVPLAAGGLSADGAPDWARDRPVEMVLVVEGAARRVPGVEGVRVVSAPRSGDDTIVEFVTERLAVPGPTPYCLVVTADNELRERVQRLGAEVAGPRTVYHA